MLRNKLLILAAVLGVMCCASAFAFPPSGWDYVDTKATIKLYDPNDTLILMETLQMEGDADIWRGDPYDAGGGLMRVNTLMDVLRLRGHSAFFGDSVFVTLNRAAPPANGYIQQIIPGQDFPAESYFDIYYQITLGSMPNPPKAGTLPTTFRAIQGQLDIDLESGIGTLSLTAPDPAVAEALARKAELEREYQAKLAVADQSALPLSSGRQNPGDDCQEPIWLTYEGADIHLTQQYTCDRGNYYTNTCMGYYDGGEDIIYTLEVSQPVELYIELDPKGTTWTGVSIHYDCPYDEEVCIEVSTNSGSGPHGFCVYLDNGVYTIMIDTWPSPDCIPDFDLNITPCGTIEGDDCSEPIPVYDVTNYPFTTVGASYDGGGTCLTSPNIWFCYTATCTGQATISLCGSSYDTKMAVYDGCACDPLGVQLACDDDGCEPGLQSVVTIGVTIWGEYLVEVGGYGSVTGNGVITISCDSCPPPPNDNCEDVTPVTLATGVPHTFTGDNSCATHQCASFPGGHTWHAFTLTDSSIVTLDYCTTSPAFGNAWLNLAYGCPCESFTVAAAFDVTTCGDGNVTMTWEDCLGPGTYWYPVLRAPDYNAEGPYTLTVVANSCVDGPFTNDEEAHMGAEINAIPPQGIVYIDPRKLPVRDASGAIIAWVYHRHAVDPPPGGTDTIPTIGIMPIWIGPNFPSPTQPPDETIDLVGEAIIARSDPYYNEYDQMEIQTEILSMDLTGESAQFGPAILSLPFPAQGLVNPVDPDPDGQFFPAESFFDVYYQVDFPQDGLTIEPTTPPRMQTTVEALPPLEEEYVDASGEPHPVHDVQNPGVIIGWVLPIHWVFPPPTGACCDTITGLCTITDALGCDSVGGVYMGDGTDCVPNPCEQPCPTGWYPGISTIQYSSFQVDIYDPNDNTIYLGTAYAFGAGMVVQYNAPYEVSPGIWRMDVDILAFAGMGNSSLLGGQFTIGLNSQLTSSGYIQMCDSCDDNWAESHFDINYRIATTQPYPNNFIYGNALMDLPCDENWDPYDGAGDFNPPNGHSYVDPRKVPIYNDAGEIIGYTMKQHRIDQDPLGACCEAQTDLCFIMTEQECLEAQGTYMGDNVPCDPNPCDTACTGWTPGLDTINYSTFGIDWYDPSGTTLLGTVYAFGTQMIVQRHAPFEESPDIWRMNTTIVAFGGVGNDPLLGGWFTISLDPANPSDGFIRQCDSCDDNWAESHWNIYYQINTSMPFPDNVYHGLAVMHLECDANWDPGDPFTPPDGDTYNDPRKVPILNANGETIGYVWKRHSVYSEPQPGACCFETECVSMLGEVCVEQGGVYKGDNVPCIPNPCGGSCCMPPIRGNINYDAADEIDISDLITLVDYMFNDGPEPPCLEEAEINCDGSIDISDLIFLVDYMFSGGRLPCRCDCTDCVRDGSSSKAGEETRRRWSSYTAPRAVPSSCRTGVAR